MPTSHPKLGQKIEKNGMGAFGQSSNHPDVLKKEAVHMDILPKGRHTYTIRLEPFPTLISPSCHWLPFARESEPKMLPFTSLLQRGHKALILSHLSTQSLWKKWEHGNSLSSSLFAYFPKQMQQACTN